MVGDHADGIKQLWVEAKKCHGHDLVKEVV